MAAFKAQDYDTAAYNSVQALRIDPNYADAHYLLARCHMQSGDLNAAISNLGEAIAQRGDPRYLGLRALAYAELGLAAAALADATQCQKVAQDEVLRASCSALISRLTAEREPTTAPTAKPLPTDRPAPAQAEAVPVDGDLGYTCDACIKSNINNKGERIYHLPWYRSYKQTKVDTSQGERWFSNETEALSAGWWRALNCD